MKVSETIITETIPVEGVVSEAQESFINNSELYLIEMENYIDDFTHYCEVFPDNREGGRFKSFYSIEIDRLKSIRGRIVSNMLIVENGVPVKGQVEKCAKNRGVVVQYLMSLNSIAQKELGLR